MKSKFENFDFLRDYQDSAIKGSGHTPQGALQGIGIRVMPNPRTTRSSKLVTRTPAPRNP